MRLQLISVFLAATATVACSSSSTPTSGAGGATSSTASASGGSDAMAATTSTGGAGGHGGAMPDGGGLKPAWLIGKPLNEWFEIPGTVLAGSPGAPGEDPADQYAQSNRATRAYSGMALKAETSEIIVAAAGGHHDSSDNAVRSIAIDTDAPAWQLRKASSPPDSVVEDQAYYLDGTPASRHTYWTTQWVASRNRVMLLGTRFTYGNAFSFAAVNGFNLDTNQWDPKGTWSDTDTCYGSCCDATASVCWSAGADIHKWDAPTDTWSKTASFPTGVANPMVHDPQRHQLVSIAWGDGQGYGDDALNAWIVSGDGTSRVALTFTASPGFDQFKADKPAYAALDHDDGNDRFYFYESKAGAAERVYVIAPNAGAVWDMSVLSLGPGSIVPAEAGGGGVMNKFRYVPALKGFVLFSDAVRNLFFIRTG